jgi:stress-induced morphogen
MAMNRATLEAYLREAFPGAQITLTDLAGDNDHWQAEIVSESFRGKSRVAQHQQVYAALKGRMGGALHALALTTRIPD